MGSFDGAETCELVGSYLLSQLTAEYGNESNDIGLYRDDGLAAFDKTPREIEIIKKSICKVFSDNNLKITIDAKKKCVDYLDITLDLRSSSYKPYIHNIYTYKIYIYIYMYIYTYKMLRESRSKYIYQLYL